LKALIFQSAGSRCE